MKLKLCNVHKMAVANEGEERKPIFIPFGTWDYDDTITQTLDKPHAEGIAAELDKQIAAGEPGIPVYQGHPDVPEYAGKYPDKGAMGWVKKILVNEDGMFCHVEWDRDPGKGFGWFSPYWIGDNPKVGADGKKNVVVDGLTSIGLVNNPNIREFRLANEAASSAAAVKPTAFQLPQKIIDLANEYDESKHPRSEDGKLTSGGSTGGAGAAKPQDGEGSAKLTGKKRSEFLRKTNDDLENARKKMFNRLAAASAQKAAGLNMEGAKASLRESWAEITNLHKAAIRGGLKYSKLGLFYE